MLTTFETLHRYFAIQTCKACVHKNYASPEISCTQGIRASVMLDQAFVPGDVQSDVAFV